MRNRSETNFGMLATIILKMRRRHENRDQLGTCCKVSRSCCAPHGGHSKPIGVLLSPLTAWRMVWLLALTLTLPSTYICGQESADSSQPVNQSWNLHVQSTVIAQGHPSFSAEYSGANSMTPGSEVKETISFDVTAGVRLWRGAEFFGDVLVWQGYG